MKLLVYTISNEIKFYSSFLSALIISGMRESKWQVDNQNTVEPQ